MNSRSRVQTPRGAVAGIEERGVLAFRGIPYARSTAAAGRFRAPEPVAPWADTLDASRFGRASPQATGSSRPLRRFSAVPESGVGEDCLNLNVWTPATDGGRRPVLVWLHGGAFSHGSGSFHLYSGDRLARRGDVVVITVNYRLGVFGGLHLESFAGGGEVDSNLALRDQVAALEWVRENVEAFGGDPGNVTLFGQSAGAMSAATLMASPPPAGLFHRVILQSGGATNVHSPQLARRLAEIYLEGLGLDPDRADIVESLRRMDARELLAAQIRMGTGHGVALGQLMWQPTLDRELVSEIPQASFRAGRAAALPLLIGSNLDEWKMFTATDKKRRTLDEDTLRQYLVRTFEAGPGGNEGGGEIARARAETAFALYRVSAQGTPRSPGDIWASLQTDRVFHHPAIELAEAHAGRGAPTWFYRFDWVPPLAPRRVGACHSIELPFVFGTLRTPWLRPLFGASSRALVLSDRIQDAWLSFARNGDPNTATDTPWPRYEKEEGRATLLGGRAESERAMDPALRQFWKEVGGSERGF